MDRQVRDSLFCSMFSEKEYAALMFESLHPEIKCNQDELEIVTINNVLSNSLYNDLGMIYKDKFLILVEAQSSFSPNFILRAALYIIKSYDDYIREHKYNLHGNQLLSIPNCEMYVIYTADDDKYPDTITLSDTYFKGQKQAIEVTAKVIKSSSKSNILGQYITFCKIFNPDIGKDREQSNEFIEYCINNGILSKYLKKHKAEVENMFEYLFDQKEVTRLHERDIRETAMEEGIQQGSLNTLVSLYKQSIIDLDTAVSQSNVSKEEFLKLV